MKSVKFIANKARKFTEWFAKDHPHIGHPTDLGCYCAIGSWILFALAKREGHDAVFVEGRYLQRGERPPVEAASVPRRDLNHCWVEVGNTVYDITATQFKFKEKVLTYPKDSRNKQFYPVVRHTNIRSLGKFLIDWHEQSPAAHQKELRDLIRAYT